MRDLLIDQKNINQVFVEVNRLYMEAYGIYIFFLLRQALTNYFPLSFLLVFF